MHIVDYLTFSTLGKIFSKRHFDIVSYFSQETGFDISCKLSPLTICMKCQFLFSGENKTNFVNLSFAELAQSVVKANDQIGFLMQAQIFGHLFSWICLHKSSWSYLFSCELVCIDLEAIRTRLEVDNQ